MGGKLRKRPELLTAKDLGISALDIAAWTDLRLGREAMRVVLAHGGRAGNTDPERARRAMHDTLTVALGGEFAAV